MKKFTYISAALIIAIAFLISCGSDKRRNPGSIYMPDMAYSRAYEAYSVLDTNQFRSEIGGDAHKAFFNAGAVAGTIKRGDLADYPYANDSVGYVLSKNVANPIKKDSMSKADMAEAGRLYNINCGVCHGEKGLANGPVAEKVGAVANLTNPTYVAMSDGTMFHSLQYGKNNMGSYASQLSKKQRWMIINYVRTLQPKAEVAKPAATTAAVTTTTPAAGK